MEVKKSKMGRRERMNFAGSLQVGNGQDTPAYLRILSSKDKQVILSRFSVSKFRMAEGIICLRVSHPFSSQSSLVFSSWCVSWRPLSIIRTHPITLIACLCYNFFGGGGGIIQDQRAGEGRVVSSKINNICLVWNSERPVKGSLFWGAANNKSSNELGGFFCKTRCKLIPFIFGRRQRRPACW